ncbi:hypothetical protein ABT369_53010 [Dactylosporangium sp. NPDC000244]|uniref:hypothetical protein n=1 Tax=Dactylosporangium sp. NPDC000244 TaxID=3154365 RepID=UPI00331F9A18
MEMDDRLAVFDWARLEDAYGDATDIPELLRALRFGADPERSAELLTDRLVHQGFMVYSAAVAAAPILADMTLDVAVPVRVAVVQLIGRLAREARAADPVLPERADWERMWRQQLPRLVDLLSDDDVEVRRMAPGVFAASSDQDSHLGRLLTAAEHEPDEATLLGELIAAADLLPDVSADAREAAVARVSAMASSGPAQVRMGIALVLRQVRPVEATTLLAALSAPDAALWAQTWCVPSGDRMLIEWVEGRLGDDRGPRRDLGLGLLTSKHAAARRSGLGVLTRLAAGWRSSAADLRTAAFAALDDADQGMRQQALFALAVVRSPEHAARDRLAALAGQRTGGFEHLALTWALARSGDARCVPHLLTALRRDDFGFPHHQVYEATVSQRTLPSLDEILLEATAWSDRLLPDVAERLTAVGPGLARRALLTAVIGWGPAARSVLPVLLEGLQLPDPGLEIVALAAIGADSSEVPLALLRSAFDRALVLPSADRVKLIRAYAVLSGNRDPVQAELPDPASGERWSASALHLVGALGPQGAVYADRLEPYLSATAEWLVIGAATSHWELTGRSEVGGRALTRLIADIADGRPAFPADLLALRRLDQMGYMDPTLTGVLRFLVETDARATGPAADWHDMDLDSALAGTAGQMLTRGNQSGER